MVVTLMVALRVKEVVSVIYSLEQQYSQVPFSLLQRQCRTLSKTTFHELFSAQPVQPAKD